ncbi:MAG: restriction endonuclease subunit S [Gammaproteobacteria bacterium]|nr:restriction endonuclease subunit S [Gammaproteobacteria bacterium]
MSNKRKKTLVPPLRFPEFRDDGEWEIELLKELYSFKSTNSFSRDKLNYKNGFAKNIHYGDIHTKFSTLFNIEKEDVPFVNMSVSLDKVKQECYCKEGDMIFADASEDVKDVGKSIEIVRLNNGQLLSGLHTLLARQTGQKLIVGFGGYLFKSNRIRAQIKKESQGAKVLGISIARLSGIEVGCPSNKKEQAKIANCLSSIDELITGQTKKLDSLKQHKKGLMQKLFPSERETVPPLRFPEFRDDGDWALKKLGEVVKYKNGGSFEKKASSRGKYNLITLNSIDIEGNLKNTHKKIDINDNSLSKGDMVMALSDIAHGYFLGLTAIIPDNNLYVLNQRIAALKVMNSDSFYFLRILINFNQKFFKIYGQGSSQMNLSKGDVLNFTVALPKVIEQTKIAACLSSIDKLITTQTQKLDSLKQHKKGLMQQLFPIIEDPQI